MQNKISKTNDTEGLTLDGQRSTHAGQPWRRYLRQQVEGQVHFWPFDGWNIPNGGSVIAEVYPSLWSRGFAREARSVDQHDAYSVAAWMRRADLDGTLAGFFDPFLSPAERMVAQVEGWILGVAGIAKLEELSDAVR